MVRSSGPLSSSRPAAHGVCEQRWCPFLRHPWYRWWPSSLIGIDRRSGGLSRQPGEECGGHAPVSAKLSGASATESCKGGGSTEGTNDDPLAIVWVPQQLLGCCKGHSVSTIHLTISQGRRPFPGAKGRETGVSSWWPGPTCGPHVASWLKS